MRSPSGGRASRRAATGFDASAGPGFRSDRKAPTTWLLILVAVCVQGVACDGDEAGSDRRRDSPIASSDDGPILPAAPWFEVPADWSERHPLLSPNAELEAHFTALAEAEAPVHPGDGGGRAWLESVGVIDREGEPHELGPRERLRASSHARLSIRFEVGPHGVQQGGSLFLMEDPFWYWDAAQTQDPDAPGYTTAVARAVGVRLEATGIGASFVVRDRDLAPGEQVDFVYGAGPPGARVDRYADAQAEILIAVDADGDGFRSWIESGPHVAIGGGPGVKLLAHGPAQIASSAPFELVFAFVDGVGNRAAWPEPAIGSDGLSSAHFEITSTPESPLAWPGVTPTAAGQASIDLPPFDPLPHSEGSHRVSLVAPSEEGVLRLQVRGRGALEGLAAEVAPIVVRDEGPRLVWGDLHGHSGRSDGTGTAEDYFLYARDVAGLQVIALTDHDHWGPRPIDEDPAVANALHATADRFEDPGRFVTLPGFEWTSWLHGHRHVLYFGPPASPAPIYSSVDPATDSPDALWAALRGQPALTFAHHSAGEPIATNWAFPPDPVLEPLTEIASVHGSSEASDSPGSIRGGIPGYFLRDALLGGYRLGFVGSGDSHDGHPGLAQLASGRGGLAGIFTSALERGALLAAMRRRHTFATNGIRPWLEVWIDDVPMGGRSPVEATDAGDVRTQRLTIHFEATAPLEAVDLIRTGRLVTLEATGELSYRLEREIPALAVGEFHYVRMRQRDGGVAWSSPIFAISAYE